MGVGEIAEIVNASELTLETSTGNYILLTNLSLHIGRPEDRVATTDGGALFTYGKEDNYFTATLLVSTPELSDLNDLTLITANGDMPSQTWLIKAKNVSGSTKTFSCPGYLREYDIAKPNEGKVSIDIFVRITGTWTTNSIS
jgi:hypothetical protein